MKCWKIFQAVKKMLTMAHSRTNSIVVSVWENPFLNYSSKLSCLLLIELVCVNYEALLLENIAMRGNSKPF